MMLHRVIGSGTFDCAIARRSQNMIRLSVNVNKIALLRNARGGNLPDVADAARTCIAAGCHGITVHPRPDARHITFQDVLDLAAILTVEFNIEGYPGAEFLDLVCRVRPTQATLVPDPPNVLTSNAGWKLDSNVDWLHDVLARLREAGIRTSLFVEPDQHEIERARKIGADRVELYTGPYAAAFGTPEGEKILALHRDAARLAREIGLGVNAGHDLDLKNIPAYAKTVKGLQEVSIGHALVSDALYIGLKRAVKAYLKALGSKPLAIRTKRTKRLPAS
jgi:pyridoxine 5-phosphate synthase